MTFDLDEYDQALGRYFSEAMYILVRAQDPILESLDIVDMPGPVGSRVRDRDGMDIALDPGRTSVEIPIDHVAVREGNYDELYEVMVENSRDFAEQLAAYVVDSLQIVTDGTGNVVDAGGRPLTFDLIYEVLEKMDLILDENDELEMPSILINPLDAEKLNGQPKPTDEQQQRLHELLARKKEEALARRRRRRLS